MEQPEIRVMRRYVADNGDVFVKIYCKIFDGDEMPDPESEAEEIACVAVIQSEPLQHLSYYRKDDGKFIATAGVHIHSVLSPMTEYLYERRKSSKTTLDTIANTLYFE